MLVWTLVFLVIALAAAIFGLTNTAAESTGSAKVLFTIFVIMFLASVAFEVFAGAGHN